MRQLITLVDRLLAYSNAVDQGWRWPGSRANLRLIASSTVSSHFIENRSECIVRTLSVAAIGSTGRAPMLWLDWKSIIRQDQRKYS